MKKFSILICTLMLVLGLLENANALSYTNVTPLWKILSGTGSYSWTHETPSDFEVPFDIVNSASLEVFANFVDGNDDKITIMGAFEATLSNARLVWTGGWNFDYVGTMIDIPPAYFNPWTTGKLLDVKLDYIESNWCKSLLLEKSIFKLDYDNGIDPTVTSVPEPKSMLMLGSVLLGLVSISRKRFINRN